MRVPLLGSLLAFPLFVAGAQDSALFDLTLDELLQLEVVSASGIEERLKDVPASLLVISAQQMRQRGYLHLGDLLYDLPGFDIIDSQTTPRYTAYQRGFRSAFFTQRTLLLIDGRVDNHLWSHSAYINHQYPLSHLERVEVLYGPSSAIYGPNAFLGVINLITRHSQSPVSINARLTYGQAMTRSQEISALGQKEDISFKLAYKHYTSNGTALSDFAPGYAYTDEDLLNREDLWGPIRQQRFRGELLNQYGNYQFDRNLMVEVSSPSLTLGGMSWRSDSGYGVHFSFDRSQPNQRWSAQADSLFLKHTLALEDYRLFHHLYVKENRLWGNFAESIPEYRENQTNASLVSLSDWNTLSSSWRFEQAHHWQMWSAQWQLGLKYERKDLTRAYDVCGYWIDAFCSAYLGQNVSLGPEGLGPGITTSNADTIPPHPLPLENMPSQNSVKTTDKGMYLQQIREYGNWLTHLGVSYDSNSIHGSYINPRISVSYALSGDVQRIKLVYGEAFQEPPPILFYGGWTGRNANAELKPEKVKNLELLWHLQGGKWVHQISLFHSWYQDVIRTDATNSGGRKVVGIEAKSHFSLPVLTQKIEGHIYYTYNHTHSSISYNSQSAQWEDDSNQVGDISPHKIQWGANIPLTDYLNWNISGRFLSRTSLFSRNPLSAEGVEIGSYHIINSYLAIKIDRWSLGIRVNNLLDKAFFYPGVGSADAGNDTQARSQGFNNSLIPGVGRQWMLNLDYTF